MKLLKAKIDYRGKNYDPVSLFLCPLCKQKVKRLHYSGLKQKSCGCVKKGRIPRHGGARTRLYSLYYSIKRRCSDRPRTKYEKKHYTDKKIKICKEWQDFSKFQKWAYDNGYNEKKKIFIRRYDYNKGFDPGNCYFSLKSARKQIGGAHESKNKR